MVQEETALAWERTAGCNLNRTGAETGPDKLGEGESSGLSVSSFAFAVAAAHDSSESLALAAADSGLFYSRDSCRSWQRAPGPIGALPMLAVCLAPFSSAGPRALLGTTGGIAYSHDLSEWRLARLPQDGIDSISMGCIAQLRRGRGHCLPAHSITASSIRSIAAAAGRRRHFGLLDMRVFTTAISPLFAQDQTVLAGTPTGIFFSPNGGLAWREAAVPDEDDAVLSIAFSPDYQVGGLIAAGTEGGLLLKSLDAGHTWQYMETPCAGKSINALTFLPQGDSDPLMLLGAADRIYASTGSGSRWHAWDAGQTVLTLASYADGAQRPFVLAGLKQNGILRGQPEGASRPQQAPNNNRKD